MSSTNLTLSAAALEACHPVSGEGGEVLRALCPFHGSDHQRSLRVTLTTGRFHCYACGAWGYLEETRQQWQKDRQRTKMLNQQTSLRRRLRPSPLLSSAVPSPSPPVVPSPAERPLLPALADLQHHLAVFQAALPRSRGEAYLRHRGISLALAQQMGVGYAAPGMWPHRIRDWRYGRLVIPHTTPDGDLLNLYGRAVETTTPVPKGLCHDHLPGDKGYFNALAFHTGTGPLWICEGAFDALALMEAGCSRVIALFGVHGWRWEWARACSTLVFALDTDPTGQQQWRVLARQAVLRGKQVAFLPPESYGGYKDVNAAWMAGVLTLGQVFHVSDDVPEYYSLPEHRREQWEERAAIIEWDGGLTRHEAEKAAWKSLIDT